MTPAHAEQFESTIECSASCDSDRAESTKFGDTESEGGCDHES
jgi:hypothetical protein